MEYRGPNRNSEEYWKKIYDDLEHQPGTWAERVEAMIANERFEGADAHALRGLARQWDKHNRIEENIFRLPFQRLFQSSDPRNSHIAKTSSWLEAVEQPTVTLTNNGQWTSGPAGPYVQIGSAQPEGVVRVSASTGELSDFTAHDSHVVTGSLHVHSSKTPTGVARRRFSVVGGTDLTSEPNDE